ncbi:MAG: type III secretion system cytoplasmic ring protein SctQ [Geminicoccaceae bacterium]
MNDVRIIGPEEGARLEPLRPRRMSRGEANLACTFARHRKPVEFMLGETRLRLRPLAGKSLVDGHAIDLVIGGTGARLVIPPALRHRLLQLARADLPLLHLPADIEGLVLERLFEPVLPGIERMFGTVRLGTGGGSGEPCGRRDFALQVDGDGARLLSLRAPEALLQQIDRVWRKRPAMRRRMGALPLNIAIRTGRTRLDPAGLGDLDPGDIVFADATPAEQGCFLGVVEDRLAVPLRIDGNRLVALSAAVPPHRLPAPWQPLIEDLMPDSMDQDDDRAWSDVPLDVVFELQRLTLPLRDLQSLAPGQVVELGRPLSEAVDIRVRGRRIGRGELVVVQERLGVRIVALNGGSERPAARQDADGNDLRSDGGE